MSDFCLLTQIQSHCRAYAVTFESLLLPKDHGPQSWRKGLLDILLNSAQLYVDYLLLNQHDEAEYESRDLAMQAERGLEAEYDTRLTLGQVMEQDRLWLGFDPDNPFSNITGLRDLSDYKRSLSLHLPEVYAEVLRVEENVAIFLGTKSSMALGAIEVGMEHLGRNHIAFVIPALQWATEQTSWTE